MALANTAPQHIAPANASSSTDPFFQSTPRTGTAGGGLSTLMATIQQVLPPSASAAPPAPSIVRASRHGGYHRPQCTHTTMNRVRGVACSMCYTIPELGFAYRCQQDHHRRRDDSLPDIDFAPAVPDGSDYFDAKARMAEYLKMSPSVIRGIRNGDYDVDQVHTLITQREHLIRAIKEQEREKGTLTVRSAYGCGKGLLASMESNFSAMTPAGTPANTPVESTTTTPVKPQSKCNHTICQSCRPYFQDRLWASFESVFGDDLTPLTEEETATLPMMNPRIAMNMGLRGSSASASHSAQSQQSTDVAYGHEDDGSVDWSSGSDSDHLDNTELYPCPGPLFCPVWSRHSGCAYDAGFDDGRRAENHGFYFPRLTPENSRRQLNQLTDSTAGTPTDSSPTASSVSLPTPVTASMTPFTVIDEEFDQAAGEDISSFGDEGYNIQLHCKTHNGTLGGEVAVKGGVALTEEAVKSCMPDIFKR